MRLPDCKGETMEKPGRPERAADAAPPAPDTRLSYDAPGPPRPPPRPGTRLSFDAGRQPVGRRVPRAALAVALVVVVGGAVAVTQLGGDEGSKPASPPAKAPAPGAAPTPGAAPAPEAGEPTQDDVRALLRRYTESYGAEDLDALRALFAPDALRISEGVTQSREEAMATYTKQFGDLTDPTYTLDAVQIETSPKGATARGRYTIRSSSSSSTATGGVEFRLEDRDGRLVIERLSIDPD